MSRLISFSQYLYYAGWFMKAKLGFKKPLVNTMIIHYACNIRCEHCAIVANVDQLPPPHSISFENASKVMREEHDKGARILFFEGGEPTIWRDGDKDFHDLIAEGRKAGYFVIGYTTNGVGKIYEETDVISVSLDGPREVHDKIRGAGVYDKLMDNLRRTAHPNIFANMVVTRTNIEVMEETVRLVASNPRIKGIMLNFLTPPPQSLALSLEEKKRVVQQAQKLKKEGLPILNTDRALRELLIEDYSEKCPYWISEFVMPNGDRYNGCPMQNTEACRQCGFDAVREYRLIVAGNLETVRQMSKRFAVSKSE